MHTGAAHRANLTGLQRRKVTKGKPKVLIRSASWCINSKDRIVLFPGSILPSGNTSDASANIVSVDFDLIPLQDLSETSTCLLLYVLRAPTSMQHLFPNIDQDFVDWWGRADVAASGSRYFKVERNGQSQTHPSDGNVALLACVVVVWYTIDRVYRI